MTCNEKSIKYVKNPELYVCNPKTNQWVKKTSALGKKIMKQGKNPVGQAIPVKKPAAVVLPPPPPKFHDFSPSSIPTIFKDFLKKKIASLREPRNKYFDSLKFSVQKLTSMTTKWKTVTIDLAEFPYKFKHLNDYPYNHLGDKIKTKFDRLLYTDINGLSLNAEWFEEQVMYIKSLSQADQKLIYDYSVSPSLINTEVKRLRLNEIIINSPPLKNRLTVWRGVRSDYLTLDVHKFYQNDKRFVSTSVNPKVAIETFMSGLKCCLLKITLLPGTRALFMGLSKHEIEHEILLPTDSLFYVLHKKISVLNGPRPLTMFNMVCVKEIKKGLKLSFKNMKVKQKPADPEPPVFIPNLKDIKVGKSKLKPTKVPKAKAAVVEVPKAKFKSYHMMKFPKKPAVAPPVKPTGAAIQCNPKNKSYLLNPDNFVCNGKTGRWVLKTSSIGKNILKTKPPTPTSTLKSIYDNLVAALTSTNPAKKSVCNEKSTKYLKNPDMYVCNPKSKMWVLKTSALGKKLVETKGT